FLGRQVGNKDNLQQLSETCATKFKQPLLENQPFKSWDDFFNFLIRNTKKKTIIAFDEYPYFVSSQPGLSSIFQQYWDEKLKRNKNIKLILCGSSFGMMINETLSEKAPLFGRRTGQIHLKPLNFYQSKKFFPKLKFPNFLSFFSITGGNPEYLNKLSKYTQLQKAIEKEILNKNSPLYEEIDFLLKEELREPKNYYSILKSLAFKRNKISDIIEQTGLKKTIIHKYLFVLENLGLIEKEIPITEKQPQKSRKGIYRIKDQFVNFWFNFVLPYRQEIELGNINLIKSKLKIYFPAITQENYQRIAPEIINQYSKKIGNFEKIGRFWHNETEIDNIGTNSLKNEIAFIESKWSNKKVGINTLKQLREKIKNLDLNKNYKKEKYILLSKSGFTQKLLDLTKQKNNIFLIKQDKLII
ncbi:ATP-binding protein, partial [Patescibacteria group bacterium]|nr:ATP-binding protein [Patescibacteria group bacterium]